MKKRPSHKWCIFRLDNKTFGSISKELVTKGYHDLKVCIPVVSILKKRVKGRDIYEDIPLLFNYGFLRIPTELAYSRPYINKLKKDIQGITTFVNSLDTLHPKKKRKRVDGEDFDDYSIVATVSPKEIRRFKKLSRENAIYSFNELSNLKEGDYITLRGYPFDGVSATIKEVNLMARTVKVLLYPLNGNIEVNIAFDNVAYSIYHNYDEDKLSCQNNEIPDSPDTFNYIK